MILKADLLAPKGAKCDLPRVELVAPVTRRDPPDPVSAIAPTVAWAKVKPAKLWTRNRCDDN